MRTIGQYDDLYVRFIYYFNVERDYFECHEVLEELWLEEGRNPLWQGLLQVAVGLYHFRNGNRTGAVKLLTGATEKLEPYPGSEAGINLAKLLQESKLYLNKLIEYDEKPFEFYDLDIEVWDDRLKRLVDAYVQNPPKPHDEA